MTVKETTSAADFLPDRKTLPALARAAEHCEGCLLFANATQTVFGSGRPDARLMLIGEQPGDQEDQQGEPFVGPAGKLLRSLLEEARIGPEAVYLTNAVKHFKWTPSGKRRLHAKPTMREVKACKPWLIEEIEVLEPQVLVCLGATALQSLLGGQARLTKMLGEKLSYLDRYPLIPAYHPSAILRAPDDTRREMRQLLLEHLVRARKLLHA